MPERGWRLIVCADDALFSPEVRRVAELEISLVGSGDLAPAG